MRFRVVALLAALLLLTLLPASFAAAAAPQARASQSRAHVLAYWTPARMQAARPRDFAFDSVRGFHPAAKPGGGGGGGGAVTGASWPASASDPITRATGRVVFSMGGGDWICSGSVATDTRSGFSTVLTAGHCVVDSDTGEFATNWMFIPAFDLAPTYTCANATYGCWTAKALVARREFATAGAFNDTAVTHDWGFAVVAGGGKQANSTAQLDTTVGGTFALDATTAAAGSTLTALGLSGGGQVPRQGPDLLPGAGRPRRADRQPDLRDGVRHDRRLVRRAVAVKRLGRVWGEAPLAQLVRLLRRQEHVRADLQLGDHGDVHDGDGHDERRRPRSLIVQGSFTSTTGGAPAGRRDSGAEPGRRRPSSTMTPDMRRPFDLHDPRHVAGLVVAVAMWVAVIALSNPAINVSDPFSGQVVTAQDARSYYGLNLADLYTGRSDWNTIGAYPYSPAFAQLVYPLNLLPWAVFVAAWTAILIGAVYWLTGPDLFLLGLVVGAMEIAGGNVTLLLAVAIVAGFKRPWTWAFVILTKITPGVALLWFALRREWRSLAIALGATAAVLVGLVRVLPGQWRAWVDLLIANQGKGGTWAAIPIPLVVRAPIGVLLVIWGAPRNQRWTVPVCAMLALPALWYGSLSMLLAVIPLTTPEERARGWARVRGWFVRAPAAA